MDAKSKLDAATSEHDDATKEVQRHAKTIDWLKGKLSESKVRQSPPSTC